jgi:hypothetical protein
MKTPIFDSKPSHSAPVSQAEEPLLFREVAASVAILSIAAGAFICSLAMAGTIIAAEDFKRRWFK